MATPDATNYLAFLDVHHLFELIENNWQLFEPSLLDETVWPGRVVELKKIRRRIAHCRRPNTDDLSRLEQMLRDLESGAFKAFASFNNTSALPNRSANDPVLEAWRYAKHKDAGLIKHADEQYSTQFNLGVSRRPWTGPQDENQPVAGTPGYLWHATWMGGRGELRLREWWEDSCLDIDNWRDLIVYVCAPSAGHLSVSFAAVDDPSAIADAIGYCFQAVLHNQAHSWPGIDEDWSQPYNDLDPRIQTATGWSIVTETTTPISIFGA